MANTKAIISGIDRIIVSVSSIKAALSFYVDILGMEVVGCHSVDGTMTKQRWGLKSEIRGESVFLRYSAQNTILELINFDSDSGPSIHSGFYRYEYGVYDIAFRVHNLDYIYNELKKKGFDFISPLITYTSFWTKEPRSIKEVLLVGPDHVPVALIEQRNQCDAARGTNPVIITDVAQYIEDIDRAIYFYQDILGLEKCFDEYVPNMTVQQVIGLSPSTRIRIAMFRNPGKYTPVVEFIQLPLKTGYADSASVPPGVGIFTISFKTDNISHLQYKLTDAGYDILGGPLELTIHPHGKIEAITARGPNKEILEFYETRE